MEGANAETVANTFFEIYLKQYIEYIHDNKLSVPSLLQTFAVKYEKYMLAYTTLHNIETNIQDTIIKDREHFILSGWRTSFGGHAVVAYISRASSDKWKIRFCNSGAGLQYQNEYTVIEYQDVTLDQLVLFIRFNRFASATDEKREHLFWVPSKDENYYFIKEMIPRNKMKIDENIFYKHIFEIFGSDFKPLVKGTPQLSSSCTVYSLYWFVYSLLHENNKSTADKEMESFMMFLKTKLIDSVRNELKSITYASARPYMFNVAQILQKQGVLDPGSEIISHLKSLSYKILDGIYLTPFIRQNNQKRLQNEVLKLESFYKNFEKSKKSLDDLLGIHSFSCNHAEYACFRNAVFLRIVTEFIQVKTHLYFKDGITSAAFVNFTKNIQKMISIVDDGKSINGITDSRKKMIATSLTEITVFIIYFYLKVLDQSLINSGKYDEYDPVFATDKGVTDTVAKNFVITLFCQNHCEYPGFNHNDFLIKVIRYRKLIFEVESEFQGGFLKVNIFGIKNERFYEGFRNYGEASNYSYNPASTFNYSKGIPEKSLKSFSETSAVNVNDLYICDSRSISDTFLNSLSSLIASVNTGSLSHGREDLKLEFIDKNIPSQNVYWEDNTKYPSPANLHYEYENCYRTDMKVMNSFLRDASKLLLKSLDVDQFCVLCEKEMLQAAHFKMFLYYLSHYDIDKSTQSRLLQAKQMHSGDASIIKSILTNDYFKFFYPSVNEISEIPLCIFNNILLRTSKETFQEFFSYSLTTVANIEKHVEGFKFVTRPHFCQTYFPYPIYEDVSSSFFYLTGEKMRPLSFDEKEEHLAIFENNVEWKVLNHHVIRNDMKVKTERNRHHFSVCVLLEKLNVLKIQFLMLQAEDQTRIVLEDYPFEFNYFDSDITVVDKTNPANAYILVTRDYGKEIVIWSLFLTNGFILSDRENNLSLLLLMEPDYINGRLSGNLQGFQKPYFVGADSETVNFWQNHPKLKPLSIPTFHLLRFHFTNLSFKMRNSNDFGALFISMILASNLTAICLLINQYYIEVQNKNNVYYGYLRMFQMNIDFPYWSLLHKHARKTKHEYDNRSHYFSRDFNLPKKTIHLSTLCIPERKIIEDASKEITSVSKAFYEADTKAKSFTKNIRSFLEQFRYRCKKCDVTISDVEESKEKDYVFELFKDGHIPSLKHLYISEHLILYKRLYRLKFNNLRRAIDNVEEDCGHITKVLEELDPLFICGFEESRDISQLLLELHAGIFLRKDQKSVFDKFCLKLHSYPKKGSANREVKSTAYEILMGKGKTTTLTPLLLFYCAYGRVDRDYFNYNIVLPKHLLQQSFEVVLAFSELFNDVVTKIDVDNFENIRHKINIVSDAHMKIYVLQNRGRQNIINPECFFIFDEIDSLINPLKSDLNISLLKSKHPFQDYVTKALYNLAEIMYKTDYIDPKNIRRVEKSLVIEEVEILSVLDDNDIEFLDVFTKKVQTTVKQIQDGDVTFNKNYGFSKIAGMTAIPYNAIDSPMEGSEFTDFELSILLTCLSYFYNGFREADIVHLIEYLRSSFYQEDTALFLAIVNVFLPELTLFFDNEKSFIYLVETGNKSLVKQLTESLNGALKHDYTHVEKTKLEARKTRKTSFGIKKMWKTIASTIPRWNSGSRISKEDLQKSTDAQSILRFYMTTLVFKQFKIPVDQYNISFVDILDSHLICHKIIFSGTVNFNLPSAIIQEIQPKRTGLNSFFWKHEDSSKFEKAEKSQLSEIVGDELTQNAIHSALLGAAQHELTSVIRRDDQTEDSLLAFLKEKGNLEKYSAVIDVAGIILKRSARQFIDEIYNHLPRDTVVLYVNEGARTIYDPNGESYEKEYQNDVFPRVFIVYDNKNCVGIDFKQPFQMHALVTINETNDITETSQGVYRLRNINIGHTFDFFDCCSSGERDIYGIHQILVANEKASKENLKEKASLQCLKFVKRQSSAYVEESYFEKVYIETIAVDEKYIDEKTFYDTVLFKNLGHNLKFKSSEVSFLKTNLNFNVEVEKEVAVQILSNEVFKENDVETDFRKCEYTLNKYFGPEEVFTTSVKFRGVESKILLNFEPMPFKAVLSNEIVLFAKKYSHNVRTPHFYMLRREGVVTIITSAEFSIFMLNFEKLDTKDLSVYDMAGNCVFGIENDVLKKRNSIFRSIYGLLFIQNRGSVSLEVLRSNVKAMSVMMLTVPDILLKLQFLRYLNGRKLAIRPIEQSIMETFAATFSEEVSTDYLWKKAHEFAKENDYFFDRIYGLPPDLANQVAKALFEDRKLVSNVKRKIKQVASTRPKMTVAATALAGVVGLASVASVTGVYNALGKKTKKQKNEASDAVFEPPEVKTERVEAPTKTPYVEPLEMVKKVQTQTVLSTKQKASNEKPHQPSKTRQTKHTKEKKSVVKASVNGFLATSAIAAAALATRHYSKRKPHVNTGTEAKKTVENVTNGPVNPPVIKYSPVTASNSRNAAPRKSLIVKKKS